LTSVPIFSPRMASGRASSSHKFSTRIGSLFSIHRETAVLSITSRRRFRVSM